MQALDACLRLFTDEGDVVACEDPCYRGASALFRANRLKIFPVPVDENGMDVSILPTRKPPRLVYVTPAHQAPLGSVMSASRRLRLIEWAKTSSSVVFEDDYDGEYRYGGHPIPALQAHDDGGVVFHSGSFSKTLFPALRLAYLVVPDSYVDALSATRSMTSRYPGISDQSTLARFIADGHFARHLGRMRKLYAERRNALDQLFSKYIKGAARLSPVEAGLQTACEFMIDGTEEEILNKMKLARLDIRGINDYRIDVQLRAMCILGFAAFNIAEIKQGVIKMANIIDQYPGLRK
jgi:GntR family transcriptional regulator/MocR family aminotransferase